jgi:hypothetical protein
MPFSHQLKFPSLNGASVTARLDRWRQEPSAFLERGDPIADISIEGTAYMLCVDFPCAFSSVIAHLGDVMHTQAMSLRPAQPKAKIFHTAVSP